MNVLRLIKPGSFDYGLKVFGFTILIAVLMSPVFYFLFNNYAPANFAISIGEAREVYLLRSSTTIEQLKSFGNDGTGYENQLNQISGYLSEIGISCEIIDEKRLLTLKPGDTLYVIDAIALDESSVEAIEHFVESGGGLIFNYYSGFNGSQGKWRGESFVKNLTGLERDPFINTLKKQGNMFCTPKVFSPLSTNVPNGPLMTFVYYDDIPLFKAPEGVKPDMMLTNWAQFDTPLIGDARLPKQYAGVLWHGFKGKGSWIYFNFPSYVFGSSQADSGKYVSLFQGMTRYMVDGSAVRVHPYMYGKNPVFVSEDTEFHFENARNFSELVGELQIPATAFCVAKLADENVEVTKELGKNPYIEVASHSYTHGPLIGIDDETLDREVLGSKMAIEKISGTPITGFRPPREEVDDHVAQKLVESGYTYTMEKNKNHLYPSIIRKDLVVISRIGTDDYAFLSNQTFDEQALLQAMRDEAYFVDALDGIYTLSVHTHLFSDPQNISLLRSVLTLLKKEDKVNFLQGREIADRIKSVSLIDVGVTRSSENYIVSFLNNNPKTVSKVTIRLYWPRWGAAKTFKSDTTGVKFSVLSNENERYSDITFYDVTPRKQFSLFARYQ
ncbi:polysaccharide deacetylase family protein [Sulfuricurvum sp.]|uniref:polysaccharide deacetylase family protein n=1 Tax=Sulfuricurvum sp. TaxID=2025608 RepID=UPI00262081FC|nr:polysaccharide deacetylase family protein [Sulfuricurvum sp.]MDD2266156.1 polysaccharide deacetylase family protein [Sulfuricurvum sp.]MDD2784055.1 polysaccharide deacetylase family protein [Sulfuricurvum sp.]